MEKNVSNIIWKFKWEGMKWVKKNIHSSLFP